MRSVGSQAAYAPIVASLSARAPVHRVVIHPRGTRTMMAIDPTAGSPSTRHAPMKISDGRNGPEPEIRIATVRSAC